MLSTSMSLRLEQEKASSICDCGLFFIVCCPVEGIIVRLRDQFELQQKVLSNPFLVVQVVLKEVISFENCPLSPLRIHRAINELPSCSIPYAGFWCKSLCKSGFSSDSCDGARKLYISKCLEKQTILRVTGDYTQICSDYAGKGNVSLHQDCKVVSKRSQPIHIENRQ